MLNVAFKVDRQTAIASTCTAHKPYLREYHASAWGNALPNRMPTNREMLLLNARTTPLSASRLPPHKA